MSNETQQFWDQVLIAPPGEIPLREEIGREAATAEDLATWLSDFTEAFISRLHMDSLRTQIELLSAYSEVFGTINEVYQALRTRRDQLTDRDSELLENAQQVIDACQKASTIKFPHQSVRHLPNSDNPEVRDLTEIYLHDVGNAVQSFGPFADTIRDGAEFGLTYEMFASNIQEGLTSLITLQRAFDLKEFTIPDDKVDLITLINYTIKKARYHDQENERVGVDELKVVFSSDITKEQLQPTLEVALNIPAFVRILSNLVQNARKAYQLQMERGIPVREPVLRIHTSIVDSQLLLVADDDGPGFPESPRKLGLNIAGLFKGDKALVRSALDETVIRLYEPQKGLSNWSQNIEGNGVGLKGIVANLEELGITVRMGSKLDEKKRKTGARTEILVPLLQKPPSQ